MAETTERKLLEGLPLRCQACGHRWHFTTEKGIIVEAFIARLAGNLICPKCGNHSKARKKAIMIEGKTTSITLKGEMKGT